MDNLTEQLAQAAELIAVAKRVIVFTGAGVSTESGIPDFRSPGGIWTRYDPEDFTYQKFLSSQDARKRYWHLFQDRTFLDARPNPGHLAIAELDRLGKLDCVITQNIDGLHQAAGLPDEKVIELHGTQRWVRCLSCKQRYTRPEILERLAAGEAVPECRSCGGILKPATISFGEAMPERETREAELRSHACDLFLVVGSTLVVYPAAYMPLFALQSGARLIIVNLSETPLDHQATLVIHGKAGDVLPAIIDRLRQKLLRTGGN
ncbi:MAG: NAD-dependent deacylase [Chloroflexi bacterium]|nr:NAD-dependent deacylase [Chloroflexota bacterium]